MLEEDIPQRCAVCGGSLIPQLITHQVQKGEEILVFDNVPAFVCSQCEGVWITGDVKDKIDEIVQQETEPNGPEQQHES